MYLSILLIRLKGIFTLLIVMVAFIHGIGKINLFITFFRIYLKINLVNPLTSCKIISGKFYKFVRILNNTIQLSIIKSAVNWTLCDFLAMVNNISLMSIFIVICKNRSIISLY